MPFICNFLAERRGTDNGQWLAHHRWERHNDYLGSRALEWTKVPISW